MARRAASVSRHCSEGWNLACPDWEKRLKAGRSLVPDLAAEPGRGRSGGARVQQAAPGGRAGHADAGGGRGDWFRDIVRALFGSLDPVTKAAAIRELFLLVPKKNSKTTNGALLMLTALLLNERPRAPFIMTAPVQDVADLAFNAAAGAIAAGPGAREEAARPRAPEDDRAPRDEGRARDHDLRPGGADRPEGGRRADRRAARRREDVEGGERDPAAARRHAAVPGGLPRLHHDAERGARRRACSAPSS
jgi:hypothetical protein